MDIICSKPEISSVNFMNCLFAALIQNKKVIVELPSIVKKIYEFKRANQKYQYMFEDIEFRTGIDYVISSDIADGINSLQTYGVIGKLNPTYEKVVIYLTEEEAAEILQECGEDMRNAIMQLAELF